MKNYWLERRGLGWTEHQAFIAQMQEALREFVSKAIDMKKVQFHYGCCCGTPRLNEEDEYPES